jgi:hypothetical protein
MFELCEDERGFDDVADLAGAGSEVVRGTPTSGEDSEAAFAQAAQSAEQGIVAAVVDVEDVVTGGLFDRGMHADPATVVAAIGEGGQVEVGRCPVQGTEQVIAGHGRVVHGAGFDLGHPQREPSGADRACTSPPCSWAFPEYHRSIWVPFTLVVFSLQGVGGEDLPVENHVCHALGFGSLQGFVRIRSLRGQYGDGLVVVAVGRGSADTEPGTYRTRRPAPRCPRACGTTPPRTTPASRRSTPCCCGACRVPAVRRPTTGPRG